MERRRALGRGCLETPGLAEENAPGCLVVASNKRNVYHEAKGRAPFTTGSRLRRKILRINTLVHSSRRPPLFAALSFAAFCAAGLSPAGRAQAPLLLAIATDPAPVLSTSSSLPDAPEVVIAPTRSGGWAGQAGSLSTAPMAKPYAMVIQPGQTAPKISKRTEVLSGIVDSFAPADVIGWLVSEGYSYGTDGSPNYPQTGKGFAQGLGAAAARAVSENIFSEAILAPVLHEDPRYYRLGKGHNFFARLTYAGTRGLITRTDGGHRTVNIANIGGNLAGAALTPVYYPVLNQSGTEVLKTFGGSVGGSALGFVVEEFIPDLFHHRD